VALLDGDPRGAARELDCAPALRAGTVPPEVAVLADWLEERGAPVASAELAHALAVRAAARKLAVKNKRARG
jgi:hypothetical protein